MSKPFKTEEILYSFIPSDEELAAHNLNMSKIVVCGSVHATKFYGLYSYTWMPVPLAEALVLGHLLTDIDQVTVIGEAWRKSAIELGDKMRENEAALKAELDTYKSALEKIACKWAQPARNEAIAALEQGQKIREAV